MSEALAMIVKNYVHLGDRNALNDMRAHRAKLLTDMRLNRNDAFDASFYTNTLEAEIATIDGGLARLEPGLSGGDWP
jgi:hypothetical protein